MHHLRSHSRAAEDSKVYGMWCCGVGWLVPSHFTGAYCLHLQGQAVISKIDSCKSESLELQSIQQCMLNCSYIPCAACCLSVVHLPLWDVMGQQISNCPVFSSVRSEASGCTQNGMTQAANTSQRISLWHHSWMKHSGQMKTIHHLSSVNREF